MVKSHALLRLSRHLFTEGNRIENDVGEVTVEGSDNGYRISFSISNDFIEKSDPKVMNALEILTHIIDLMNQE